MSFQEDLKNIILSNIPDAKLVSGGTEIAMRCRFCGDSINPNSKHFYLSLGDQDKPPMYHCKKCNESGIMTQNIFRDILGVYDIKILEDLLNVIKKATSKPGGQIYNKEFTRFRLNNNFARDDRLTQAKLNYLNHRLGTNMTVEEALANKIVFNLYDLLNSNGITSITRHQNITNELDESFMGFISLDNNFINMRNLRPGKVYEALDKRYVNYNIFNKNTNLERYYVLPTKIYAGSIEPVKLNISEGPFDILSIFYNVRNQDRNNSIYSSIGGKSYLNIIKYFITMMGLINIEIHLYIDNDITIKEIEKLYNSIYYYNLPIYVHKNIYPGEKDFGVRPENIKEHVERL